MSINDFIDQNIEIDVTFVPSPDSDIAKVGIIQMPIEDGKFIPLDVFLLKDGTRMITEESMWKLFPKGMTLELAKKYNPKLAEDLENPTKFKL